MPAVGPAVLELYDAVSLYDSPYGAHDDGRAVDLYPSGGRPVERAASAGSSSPAAAPSPVAGEVVAVERLGAPSKSYAPPEDVVLAIDTGTPPAGPTFALPDGEPSIARVLHVDPAVEVGDRVAVGDDLGEPIRSGFFAPWVQPHLHLEFRARDADLTRASGAVPLALDVDVTAVEWDGRGTVREVGETYAVLDRPRHPAPGDAFAAIGGWLPAGGDGAAGEHGGELVPLDGGLPHYEHGGVLSDAPGDGAAVELLGARVGRISRPDGVCSEPITHATLEWDGPTVTVDGTPIHGLSLAATRDRLGAKLVCPDLDLAVGDEVRVAIEG